MTPRALARLRAIFGAAFIALGLGIGIRLVLLPQPLNAKLMGLLFAIVLVALGVVRMRAALAIARGGVR